MNYDFLKIPFENMKIGLKVRDKDWNVGVVSEVINPYSVRVNYENGSQDVHCLDRRNLTYSPLFKYYEYIATPTSPKA